jgi:hypothetical protein
VPCEGHKDEKAEQGGHENREQGELPSQKGAEEPHHEDVAAPHGLPPKGPTRHYANPLQDGHPHRSSDQGRTEPDPTRKQLREDSQRGPAQGQRIGDAVEPGITECNSQQNREEERTPKDVASRAVEDHCAPPDPRRTQFDKRIVKGDRDPADPASPAQPEPTDQRDQIPDTERPATGRAMGAG